MTASRKPVVSWTVPQAPLTDANGHITWAWIKWFQGIQQTINSAFDQQGNFDGNLGVDVSIVSRPVTLLTILQNIDDTGVVTAAGIDFARPYLNKDTDHINDGLGNPLAGGRVAYAAMVGSGPHAGQILVFDGSTWQPHAKATTIPKAAHEWLDSYNDATGTFTASQPNFIDLIGIANPAQIGTGTPLAGYYVDGATGAWTPLPASGITQLTGDVTAGPGTGSQVATIPNATVTLAKIQNATNNAKLLGSGATGSGASYAELSLGSGLSMSGTTLNVAGAGGGSGLFLPVLSAIPTRASTGLTTAFNATGSFVQTDSAMGVSIYDTNASTTAQWEGLVKAYPGSSYTLTSMLIPTVLGSDFYCLGIVIMDTTSGKFLHFGLRWHDDTGSGYGWEVAVMAWNSPSSFNSFPTGGTTKMLAPFYTWLQIVDSGTNITFNMSADGVIWQQVYTVSKASSFLGSSGFNFLGIGIFNFRTSGTSSLNSGMTLASWSGA